MKSILYFVLDLFCISFCGQMSDINKYLLAPIGENGGSVRRWSASPNQITTHKLKISIQFKNTESVLGTYCRVLVLVFQNIVIVPELVILVEQESFCWIKSQECFRKIMNIKSVMGTLGWAKQSNLSFPSLEGKTCRFIAASLSPPYIHQTNFSWSYIHTSVPPHFDNPHHQQQWTQELLVV